MPEENRFAHQRYSAGPPVVPWELISSEETPSGGSEAAANGLKAAGRRIREAGVRALLLAHGTFAGDDASGLLRDVSRLVPQLSQRLQEIQKQTFDRVAGDAGNYTPEYVDRLQSGLEIPVQLFHWSSENHHIARADAAIELLLALVELDLGSQDRVLLWGHSHAGNVFALLTNLLAADAKTRNRFFFACRSFRVWKTWQQAEAWLARPPEDRRLPQLDLVTFGTPIRYGWDTGGYDRLLHVIHQRPRSDRPEYLTGLPRGLDDFLQATDGDYIQHLGIAGTNFAPNFWAWRTWSADVRLGRLLQRGIRRRDLLTNLRLGMRVPQEGETLLVDYGPIEGHIGQHLAGHAVYTRERWMEFHVAEVSKRFYGQDDPQSRKP